MVFFGTFLVFHLKKNIANMFGQIHSSLQVADRIRIHTPATIKYTKIPKTTARLYLRMCVCVCVQALEWVSVLVSALYAMIYSIIPDDELHFLLSTLERK